MTESDIAATSAKSTAQTEQSVVTDGAHEYRISPEGRRQAVVLFLGVLSLWVFAVWSLINLFEDGLGAVEWVSLVLMLGIVVVAPVVGWALLEEANSRIITDETGIRYRSLAGVDLSYKWEEAGIRGQGSGVRSGRVARFFLGDDEEEGSGQKAAGSGDDIIADGEDLAGRDLEPDTRLLQTPDRTSQITNPLARILHRLSHGSSLPLYGGLSDREKLLSVIAKCKMQNAK